MISKKMIEEFERQKKFIVDSLELRESSGGCPSAINFAILIRRGIFYYLLQEQAEELASPLTLKLKTVTENLPSGETNTIMSCGFPTSGLDNYIGKLVRLGRNVIIFEEGEVVEKIEIVKKEEGRREMVDGRR